MAQYIWGNNTNLICILWELSYTRSQNSQNKHPTPYKLFLLNKGGEFGKLNYYLNLSLILYQSKTSDSKLVLLVCKRKRRSRSFSLHVPFLIRISCSVNTHIVFTWTVRVKPVNGVHFASKTSEPTYPPFL